MAEYSILALKDGLKGVVNAQPPPLNWQSSQSLMLLKMNLVLKFIKNVKGTAQIRVYV